MTALIVIALIAAVAWLVLLTIAVMLCVRQLGALTVRLELVALGGASHGHGASVGFALSEELLARAPFLRRGRRVVVLLSATCTTCERLISEFRSVGPPRSLSLPDELVVLVVEERGSESTHVDDAIAAYATVIHDPKATEIARGLRLANVPSAIFVENGLIVGNLVFLDRLTQIDDLIAGSPASTQQALSTAEPQPA